MSDVPDDDVLNPRNTTSPHALSLGDPSLVAGNIADPVWQRWREEIAAHRRRVPAAALRGLRRARASS